MNDNSRMMATQDTDSFSLKSFLLLCLRYWKWFFLSLVIWVGIGLFYIYTRQPVYERMEEILVKDQESGGGIADVSNSFSQLGLFANSTKVYNELISFTSPAVMYEVVKRLNLTMNLDRRDGLRRETLYGTNQPFNVEFPGLPDDETIGFTMHVLPNGRYAIDKMWRWDNTVKVKYEDIVTGVVDGSEVKSPIGNILVKRNPYYTPNPKLDKQQWEIDVFKQSLQGAVEKYVAKLRGDLTDQDADVISLSIEDTSKQRADDILNMVVAVYNERWIEDKNKVSIATSKFISDRLDVIEKELGQLDENIANLKSEMQVPDLNEAAKGFMAQEFKINEELLKASNMLAMSQFLKEYLEDPKNRRSILPLNTGTENMVLEQQIAAYNELLLTRNNLEDNSSEENPIVMDYTTELEGLRSSILRSVDSHIANLNNTIKNIDKAQTTTKEKLSTTPLQNKALLQVERQQLVMQELYLFLLQKREENELTQKFSTDNIRIITPPYGRQAPVSPKKTLLLLVSIIMGLVIPAGALFLAESSNTKIRTKKDVENLPVPFAGEIPQIGKRRKWLKIFQTKKRKQKNIDKPRIVVVEGKRDIPNEAFRVVRSNIDFMIERGEKAVLALTSFNPGSGKSFVAYNLGVSFALKGKKVLLIDGDLRHGSLSNYVNSPRKGLSTYLTGNSADWCSLVAKVEGIQGLSVLPIGHKPPNPAELLENGRLGTLIEEARKDYDIVLIDCPPVNIVVDTQIINQYVSRTLFVVRAGLLEKKALNDLVSLVDEKKLKNITLLLNGTKSEFSSYHTYGNYEAIDKSK